MKVKLLLLILTFLQINGVKLCNNTQMEWIIAFNMNPEQYHLGSNEVIDLDIDLDDVKSVILWIKPSDKEFFKKIDVERSGAYSISHYSGNKKRICIEDSIGEFLAYVN